MTTRASVTQIYAKNSLITEEKRRGAVDHGCGPHPAWELFGVDISEVLGAAVEEPGWVTEGWVRCEPPADR